MRRLRSGWSTRRGPLSRLLVRRAAVLRFECQEADWDAGHARTCASGQAWSARIWIFSQWKAGYVA